MRIVIPLILLSLTGCAVAGAAVDIVTLPIDVAAKSVDLATTSQSEADEERGREIRKADEKAGKEARERTERCRKGKPLPTDDCSAIPRI